MYSDGSHVCWLELSQSEDLGLGISTPSIGTFTEAEEASYGPFDHTYAGLQYQDQGYFLLLPNYFPRRKPMLACVLGKRFKDTHSDGRSAESSEIQ